MSSLFVADQYNMVDEAIGRLYKDLKIPKNLKYKKYKGRSVKFDNKIYRNLENVFLYNNKYVYRFNTGDITSYMDINEFFREYEYYGVIENVKNIVKRF